MNLSNIVRRSAIPVTIGAVIATIAGVSAVEYHRNEQQRLEDLAMQRENAAIEKKYSIHGCLEEINGAYSVWPDGSNLLDQEIGAYQASGSTESFDVWLYEKAWK